MIVVTGAISAWEEERKEVLAVICGSDFKLSCVKVGDGLVDHQTHLLGCSLGVFRLCDRSIVDWVDLDSDGVVERA